MSIELESEIFKQFLRKYNENPKGWKMVTGISSKGYPQLFVSGSEFGWYLKKESLYSDQPGIGIRIDEPYNIKINSEAYGFRPVPEKFMEKLRQMAEAGIDPSEASKLIFDILTQRPVSLGELRSPMAMQGPLVSTDRPLHLLSEKQIELDSKLDRELNKLRSRLPYG